jgi:hypothetical protein
VRLPGGLLGPATEARRPGPPVPLPPLPPPRPARRPLPTSVRLAALAVAGVAVLVAALLLTLRLHRPHTVAPRPPVEPVVPAPSTPPLPDILDLSATRGDNALTFTWRPSGPLWEPDRYVWQDTGDGSVHDLDTTPRLTLPIPGRICVRVAVRRPGPGRPPRWSPEVCGAARPPVS